MIWKKFIVVLMVCLIVSSTTVEAHAAAEAGVLSVIGGSVAAGGIGATIAAIAPPVAVIVGLALAAQGVYVALSDASEAAGMTKSDYIGTKLSEWALSSGKQYSDVCQTIADGTQITSSGNMILSGAAANEIYQFFNSLTADDYIQPLPVGNSYLTLAGVDIVVLKPGESVDVFQNPAGDIYTVVNRMSVDMGVFVGYKYAAPKVKTAYIFTPVKDFEYESLINGVSQSTTFTPGFNRNGLWYTNFYQLQASENLIPLVPYVNGDNTIINSLNGQMNVQFADVPIVNGIYSENAASIDTTVFNPADGFTTVINPGIDLTSIQSEYGKAGTITIDNYLQTLQRALDGVQDNTLAISNTLTGVLDNVAVGTYDPVGTATATQEDTAAIPEVLTPVIDIDLNPTGSAAENSLKGLQFDLTAIFPFCIPFDIVALIQKFDVQPETPAISISLPLPGVNTTLDLDLDLAPFETVARILRTMELIAFIFGLMMVTRHLIRG